MNREEKLKTDFNTFITSKFNLAEKDFYNELSTKDFFELKNLLSNINNIITLKLTIQFIAEIAGYYNFSSQTIESVVNSIQSINPNTNGFDIEISSPVKIVAEVKSNIPINNGFVFGSAQKNGILRDFSSLKNGKSKSNIDTKDYYKFFVLPDTENTRKATSNLLDLLKNNNEYINFVFEILTKTTKINDKEKIYIAFIEVKNKITYPATVQPAVMATGHWPASEEEKNGKT